MSPRHQSSEASLSATASSTASNACRLAWMSETTATFIGPGPSNGAAPLLVGFPGLGTAVLGQVLDALAGAPLRVVVLHRVDQLAHEARREVHARDDHARHLLGLDLMVDPGEGHRELVVGVADVREVRVYASHDLGREMNVYVALGAWVLVVHRASIATCSTEVAETVWRRRGGARIGPVSHPGRGAPPPAHKIIARELHHHRDRPARGRARPRRRACRQRSFAS